MPRDHTFLKRQGANFLSIINDLKCVWLQLNDLVDGSRDHQITFFDPNVINAQISQLYVSVVATGADYDIVFESWPCAIDLEINAIIQVVIIDFLKGPHPGSMVRGIIPQKIVTIPWGWIFGAHRNISIGIFKLCAKYM